MVIQITGDAGDGWVRRTETTFGSGTLPTSTGDSP